MGYMKEIFINKMNNQHLDDVDWDAPQPKAVQADGKKLWIIPSNKDGVDYKIWAYSYQQALELLPLIESF